MPELDIYNNLKPGKVTECRMRENACMTGGARGVCWKQACFTDEHTSLLRELCLHHGKACSPAEVAALYIEII